MSNAIIGLSEQVALIDDQIFLSKIGQSAIKFALQVQNESSTVAYTASRKAMANVILVNVDIVRRAFAMAAATRLNSENPTDTDIDGHVKAVWNQLSLAMFPGSE